MPVRTASIVSMAIAFWPLGCDRRLDGGSSFPVTDAALDGAGDDDGSIAGLVTNGSAVVTGGVLRLTADAESQAGSAFWPAPLPLTSLTALSVKVRFRITVSFIAADGLALVLHAHALGARALGGPGGALAYDALAPSLAVELDTHDELGANVAPHVAIVRDGHNHAAVAETSALPVVLTDGNPHTLWVRFARDRVQVWLADGDARPETPLLTADLGFADHLPEAAWLGLTAATGEKYALHEVLAFEVRRESAP